MVEFKFHKYINLAIFILLIGFGKSFCQTTFQDVLYLKNGSIIHGVIIEQVPNQSIKIQTNDKNVFFYKIEEIEKITKEEIVSDIDKGKKEENTNRGFVTLIGINFAPGIGDASLYYQGYSGSGNFYTVKNEDYSFGLNIVNSLPISPQFALGMGVGIDKYKNVAFIPFTIDARISILKSKFTPLLTLNFGYSVGLIGSKGGPITNPQLGFKYKINEKMSWLFNLGYRLQYDTADGKHFNRFKFLTISTGFIF